MANRRLSTVCHFCQSRGSVTPRRRIQHSAKRGLEILALPQNEDSSGVINAQAGTQEGQHGDNDPVLSLAETMRRWNVKGQMEDMRDAVFSLEALVKQRDTRIEVMKRLRNRSTDSPHHNLGHIPAQAPSLRLPATPAGPIPHATFRKLMRDTFNTKTIRSVLRAQLLRVEHPKDLLRIMAVTMQNHAHAEQFTMLYQPVMRALYRCRNNATDNEILLLINTIVWRLSLAGLEPHEQLLMIGMRFAARARSLRGMKKYMRLVRERGIFLNGHVFRSVVAKFSIGKRGLGEIRNGRWRRSDLLQVVTGFDDCKHLPPEQQYHLGTFLDRDDWQYLHGWLAILGRCKASDAVWNEWLLWKQHSARINPKKLESFDKTSSRNTKTRGDFWFLESMTFTGDVKRAWQMLGETEIPFSALKPHTKNRLLDEPEKAGVWTPQLTAAMLEKYDEELLCIEKAFGVTWQRGETNGEGQHILVRDQEEALDELGADDWKPEEGHGFPLEGDAALPTAER